MNKIQKISYQLGFNDARSWKPKNYYNFFGKVDSSSYDKGYEIGLKQRGILNKTKQNKS